MAAVAAFTLVCVAIQRAVGAWQADLGTGGDEAAHFVSGMLVFDYLRHGLPGSPMLYARAYYRHWPRVAIGHWPPLFYPIEAVAFALGGRSVRSALLLQAVVAGGAAGWTAWLVRRRLGWAAGIAAGAAVIASPFLLFSIDLVMLDTALGLWMLAGALAWGRFARKPGWGRAIVFAAAASGAILTKGNGIALALLPLCHAALIRDASALRNRYAWVAAALVGIVTAPWYVVTYRLAANGFVYSWGWDYTHHAIPFYLRALTTNIGLFGCIGVAGGIVAVWRGRDDATIASCAGLVLALLIFQFLAPADLSARYLIALVPAGFVLAAVGLAWLWRAIAPRPWRMGGGVAAAVLLSVNAGMAWRMPHVTPYGMDAAAHRILAANGPNRFVLVAGDNHAEGAAIASFAVSDPTQRYYVLRGSQLLASSNFMGTRYRARFAHAADMAAWLRASGIGWLILARPTGRPAMRHDRELWRTLANPASEAKLIYRYTEARGTVLLYRLARSAATPAEGRALLHRAAPEILSAAR